MVNIIGEKTTNIIKIYLPIDKTSNRKQIFYI